MWRELDLGTATRQPFLRYRRHDLKVQAVSQGRSEWSTVQLRTEGVQRPLPKLTSGIVPAQRTLMLCPFPCVLGRIVLFPRLGKLGLLTATRTVAAGDAGRVAFEMSSYGHPMPKPTTVVGNAKWLDELRQNCIRAVTKTETPLAWRQEVDASGKKKIYGHKKNLKASQTYPARFAKRVVQLNFNMSG